LDHRQETIKSRKSLKKLAGTTGLEPAASAVTEVIETATY